MKRKNTTRNALFTSIISMLLCVSMLVGATFAWFTDSVESGINQIAAGNLDVELYHTNTKDSNEKVTASTKLFDEVTPNLWEPGAVAYENLTVVNEGSLELKYQLAINFENATVHNGHSLDEALKVGVVRGGFVGATREAVLAEVSEWQTMTSFNLPGDLSAKEAETYGIVIYWEPTENDNWFNMNNENQGKVLSIDLGVKLVATQKDAEYDSFGNDYDKDASVVVSEDGLTLAQAIAQVEDNGIVFIEPGTYNLQSGPIVIEGKTVTVIGLGNVTLNKNYGNTHIFTVKNGANVTIENVTMDGQGNTREGIYVRWNSVVTLKNVVIKNTGGKDIMVDEASDAAHGEETASYVWLYNTQVEDVALCASPVTSVAATQDTFVYFNYDADSSVGSIEKQNINKKPENIYINGINVESNGMNLYVRNDAELAAALETIKNDSKYHNVQVYVHLAAGEYSADHVINQYPKWNGVTGHANPNNNYTAGVTAGDPGTVITFVGETPNTRAAVPAVVFTGNVTVNGFGNSMTGFSTATAVTNFQNVAFDATNESDGISLYVTAAANNVTFTDCAFRNATHVTLGGATPNGLGDIRFDKCTFENGNCLSGYYKNLSVTNSVVRNAYKGFINAQSSGTVMVDGCTIEDAGEYVVRTKASPLAVSVKNTTIGNVTDLVVFRGTNESAEFIDCTIPDNWKAQGIDDNSILTIENYVYIDGIEYCIDGVSGDQTLYLVPADYTSTTVTVAEGTDAIGNYAFSSNSNVKEVILASTVRDLGRGFDTSTVEKVVLNEGLTTISSRAFRSTTALKEVVISSTVTEIADNAFQKSAIKEIVIPANVKTIGETAFGASLIEKVTFEGDTAIQGYAFRGCPNLKEVIMDGYNVTFVASTLNGRNSMWFCNGESNNPNTSNITFYVKNDVIKERVLTAMGAERNNTPVVVEQTAENGVYTDENNNTYAYASNDDTLNDAIVNGTDTVYLSSGTYIIPDSAQGKTLTFVGNGDTVIATQDDGSYEGCDYSLDGATAVFENIVINTNSATYTGYARLNATYNNCTINGTYTLYGSSVFNNCTFNVTGDVYNIWTWGAPTATFNGCTFNSDGKALLLYGTENTKLTLNGCTFNDKGGLTDLKAAIEIGNDYNKSYELIVNSTVVNGYEINDKGISTGTTLWANKNSMGTDKLNVVVDGVDVY